MDGSPLTIGEMGYLKGGTHASATAVNGDGGMAVETADTMGGMERAFCWKRYSRPEMISLGVPDRYDRSLATDLNNAGDIIVGYCHHPVSGISAFRWHDSGGPPKIEELRAPQE